jgi:hypothetical protein
MKLDNHLLVVDHGGTKAQKMWLEGFLYILKNVIKPHVLNPIIRKTPAKALKFFNENKPLVIVIHNSIQGSGFSLAITFYEMSIKSNTNIKIIVFSADKWDEIKDSVDERIKKLIKLDKISFSSKDMMGMVNEIKEFLNSKPL